MRSAWLLLAAALLASGSITDRLWVSSHSLADDLYLEGHSSGDVPVDDEDGDDDGSGSGSGDYALHPLDDKDEALKRFLDISTTLRKTTPPVEPQTTASSPPSSASVAPERPRDGGEHQESREPQTARPTAAASPPSEAPPSATSGAQPTATRAEERDVAVVRPGDGELIPDAERSDEDEDAAQDGRGSRTFDVKHAEEVTSENLWERTEVLAAVIACVVVGFLCAVFLLLLLAYRMKKKDEGSYDLGDTKLGAGTVYQKAPTKEFYA